MFLVHELIELQICRTLKLHRSVYYSMFHLLLVIHGGPSTLTKLFFFRSRFIETCCFAIYDDFLVLLRIV